jgi:hypothetical protein
MVKPAPQRHGERQRDDGDSEAGERIPAPQSAELTLAPNNDELRGKCLPETGLLRYHVGACRSGFDSHSSHKIAFTERQSLATQDVIRRGCVKVEIRLGER